MSRIAALLAGLAVVVSVPAAEQCANCVAGTVFFSAQLKPTLLTATAGEEVIWVAAEDTLSPVTHILRVDALSGDYQIAVPSFQVSATVRDLESDSAAVYALISRQAGASIVRVNKTDGKIHTLVSSTRADDIQVDELHVYWISNASLQRVPKNGGDQETLYAAHGGTFPELSAFAVDTAEVFVAERAGGGYAVYAIRKTDGARRYVATLPFVSALAVGELSVYAAVSDSIVLLSKTGGQAEEFARLHRFVDLTNPTVREFVVKDGRAIARQTNAILRGRVSENLVMYAPGGRFQSLSGFSGDFAVTSCSVFQAPTLCCDLPPEPPFTIKRFCLADPEPRRRAARR